MELFNEVKGLLKEIEGVKASNADELEQFRITYLGTKNKVKPYFGEIRNVPNDQKKDFGQLLNQLKKAAETKYISLQQELSSTESSKEKESIDLSLPGDPIGLGSRHPVSLTMNRIINTFSRI